MTVLVRGWPWCEANGKLYFGGNFQIRYADLATFEVLSECWARDAKNVYLGGSVIRGADPKSFTVLNELYAKDKNRAYTMMGPIKEADVSTFEVIGDTIHSFDSPNGYAKDSHAVFHTEHGGKACLMKAADPATFAPLHSGYGCDVKHVFSRRAILLGANPDEWEFIRGSHSRSGKKAYRWNKRIKGADGNSLKSLPIIDIASWCRDDNSFFKWIEPADPEEYFQDFRRCFIFVGKVDHVELTSHDDGAKIPVEHPDAWMIADHAWIYVTPSKWLQKPDLEGVPVPEIGKPVRFGEALNLPILSKSNWMEEDRIWILQPYQDSTSKKPCYLFKCAHIWWEYLHLSDLEFITDLIVEARTI